MSGESYLMFKAESTGKSARKIHQNFAEEEFGLRSA